MMLSFLAFTVLYDHLLSLPPPPLLQQGISSVLAAISSLFSRQEGRRAQLGRSPNQGGETEFCSECFEAGLSQGSAGYPEAVSGLDVRAATLAER